MDRKRIIDELKEVREKNAKRHLQQMKLEGEIKLIENKLKNNLEDYISYIREVMIIDASYGENSCVYDFDVYVFKLSYEGYCFLDLDFKRIKDKTLFQKLDRMYSNQSNNGELIFTQFGAVIRKSDLFARLLEEGLLVESEKLDDGIRIIISEPVENVKRTLK